MTWLSGLEFSIVFILICAQIAKSKLYVSDLGLESEEIAKFDERSNLNNVIQIPVSESNELVKSDDVINCEERCPDKILNKNVKSHISMSLNKEIKPNELNKIIEYILYSLARSDKTKFSLYHDPVKPFADFTTEFSQDYVDPNDLSRSKCHRCHNVNEPSTPLYRRKQNLAQDYSESDESESEESDPKRVRESENAESDAEDSKRDKVSIEDSNVSKPDVSNEDSNSKHDKVRAEDSNSQDKHRKKKRPNRFQVISNEDSSLESKTEKNKPKLNIEKYLESDALSDELVKSNEQISDWDSSSETTETPGFKEKYAYLQGNKYYDDFRRRLQHFLPKRYHWDEADIHKLGYYWFDGPRGKYN